LNYWFPAQAGYVTEDSTFWRLIQRLRRQYPTLKVLQINVETFKGVVQLSGFADSAQAAARAVEVARSVEGVKAVKNKMSVK